ncbi:MAG: glutamine-hydrolyzing GMP synthase, partial [SAR202 cluster bacterium]|nr:glutamine-hydrolyzing GMP synthase [SAR202 cluster bacterium]
MDKILILDFGSQVTQLIARRIRKKNIYCEIHPYNISKSKIENFSPKGLILSGGPASTTLKKPLKPDNSIYSLNIPILGICYGHQLICKHLGGNVINSKKREFGKAFIKIKSKSKIFEGIYKKNNEYQVWMSHGDKVNKLPKSFSVIASTPNAKFAAIADED